MAGTGPAAKDPSQRARRNPTAAVGFTLLPAEGRTGRVPAWPLAADVQLDSEIEMAKVQIKDLNDEIEWETAARRRSALRRKRERIQKQIRELESLRKAASRLEREIWRGLWKKPQATQWERTGELREVALYARVLAKGEAGDLDHVKEARQWALILGLTPKGMADRKWAIAPPAAAATNGGRRSSASAQRTGSRARRANLSLVEPPPK